MYVFMRDCVQCVCVCVCVHAYAYGESMGFDIVKEEQNHVNITRLMDKK